MEPKYLVKIEIGENNNKFYRMIPNGSSFEVQYGRIGNTYQTDSYPIERWDSQLKSKLKKGYIDQTHLVSELSVKVVSKEYSEIKNAFIAKIVERLQTMAKIAVAENYTISSNSVTKKMVEEAQSILNILSMQKDIENFNRNLLELFRTIPRKMKKVSENLAVTKNDFSEIVQREQDLLDVMKSQVVQNKVLESDIESNDVRQTILEALGLEIQEITEAEKREIKQLLGSSAHKFYQAWKVVNKKTQKVFDEFVVKENIKNRKLLWHGSRSENFWSIINTGLLLRPNAIITGKMFGNGVYFSNDADKSLGYTSLGGSRWANGNQQSGFMALYDVAYGKAYDVYSFDGAYGGFDYNKLQQRCIGANCLHAHGGTGMLRKDEIVVYKEEQLTIKYLVEFK